MGDNDFPVVMGNTQVSLMDRIKNFLGNFNDLETFKKIEESNQKIKEKAMERNRQREIDDLNKKL